MSGSSDSPLDKYTSIAGNNKLRSTMLRNRIRLDCACAGWLFGGIDSAAEYIKVKDEETCMNY